MNQSIWRKTIKLPEFPSLEDNIKTDVLIIGGGLCGILCGYFAKAAGLSCVVAEGSRICSGISGNTTAKITSQHGLIYQKLIQNFGKDKAQLYLRANEEALSGYKKLCQNIDCDFAEKKSYIYSTLDRVKLEEEVKALHSLGYPASFAEKIPLSFPTKGAVCFPAQAEFHPLKFVAELVKDLTILENTFVREIRNGIAITDRGKIYAKKIIVCTHFPFINKHGAYFLKLYQHRSYVSAFAGAPDLDGMYADEDKNGMSFRNAGDVLLLGGSGHRTGKPGEGWRPLRDFAKRHYPEAQLIYEWAAQDCMSLDDIPYIGRYSKNTPDLYVATGFNKWGMTSSMAAAKLLTDMVLERKNDYEELFSPQRSILKPQLFVNGFESATNLLSPAKKRCPHLGCALKWNKAEHSWDCPCHGSRFAEDGKLIDNPATGDLDTKKDR